MKGVKITKYLNPLQTSNAQSGLHNNILRAQLFLYFFHFVVDALEYQITPVKRG